MTFAFFKLSQTGEFYSMQSRIVPTKLGTENQDERQWSGEHVRIISLG